MSKLLTTAFVSLALLVAVSPPVLAHDVTGTYTIGSTPGISVVCSPNCLGTGLNLGGYQFPGIAEIPSAVTIVDASGANVPFTVCQDLNADSVCGNEDPTLGPIEPNLIGCGTAAELEGFAAGYVTSVFVRALDQSCTGGATSGFITLHYEH